MDDGPATASGAADQAPDERSAPGGGTRVEVGTNTTSEPTGHNRGPPRPWGRGHLDCAHSEGNARHPSAQGEHAAAQDLRLWIDSPTTGEHLALVVSIRWLLASRSRHLEEETRTMADITFGHWTGHTPPATMDRPVQWHYVATRLMAHMGAYSPDEMNGLHWEWHQRAALRICTAMQRHNTWDIPGSPGYQGHASGHRRPRSKEVLEPSRQAAHRNCPGHHQGPPPGVALHLARTEAPSDCSPLRGTEAVLTPQGCRAARRSGTGRQGTLAAPGAATARPLPQLWGPLTMRSFGQKTCE